MDPAAEYPVSKHQIQAEYRDNQADAGRDYRTRLARPISQARTSKKRKYGNTYSESKDQPSKVANRARGQLKRENEYFPLPVRA